MSEQTDFLKDLDIDNKENVLDRPLTNEVAVPEKEETAEETEQRAKNRRERRLLEKNQQLREEAIALNARLETIVESKHLREGSEEADYLKRIEKIYGNATPEAIEATNLLKEALQGVLKTAKAESREEIVAERESESLAVQKEEQNLDDILDEVEDEHGIDMSSEADRKGFLTLLEKLSPKDRDGNIVEYADPDATAELYLSRKEKPNVRAKELASRSMTRSGASQPSKIEEDAQVKFLKEHGII